MAAGDDDIIEHAVVEVGSDLEQGFTEKLQRKINAAGRGITLKIKVVADSTGLAADVRAKVQAVKSLPTIKVKMVADATGFSASARDELRKYAATHKQPEYKVKLVADASGLSNPFTQAGNDATRSARATGRKMADALGAGLSEAGDKQDRQQAAQLQRFAREEERAQQAATRAAERESDRRMRAAEREAASVNKALSKQFTSPKLIDWGGEGVRPMNLLMASVAALTPALVAMASSAVEASTSIAALGAAGIGTGLVITGLVVAFKGLTNLLALRKTAQAEATEQAANSAATAAQNAETELRNRNNLLDAINAETKAEADLHDARKQAARDLEDLKIKVRDLQNQEREDKVSLAEAQAKNAATQRSFFASALDKARSAQDVSNAKTQLGDTQLSRKRAKEDLADSVKKGVTRADKVTAAQESLRQARARLAEARLTSANKDVTSTASKASSAQANLAAQLAKASPALRDMYNWVVKNQARFDAWSRQIQQAFLPGFNTLLNDISAAPRGGGKSTIQFFVDQMDQLGAIVSKYAGRFGAFTQTPFFRAKFGIIQANNAASLDNLGSAAEKLERPLLRILAAASPLLVHFTDRLEEFAGWLDKVIADADNSGALGKWFRDAGAELDKWIDIAGNLLTILGNIFKASLPSGQSMIERIRDWTAEIAQWTGSGAGLAKMKAFFDFFKNLPYGDIVQFFAAATELFLAFRTAKWAAANPFLTALGVLAASNPAGAAAFLTEMASATTTVLGYMADHPAQTAALLTLLSYAKLKKTFGLDLRIPAIDGLKSALTSKFSFLDKVFGGEKSTGTMTVKAAVVNLYAGTEIGGGVGGATVTPGTEAGKTGTNRAVIGNIALIAGSTLGAYLASQINTNGMDPFQQGMTSALQGALSGAALGAWFGPIGALIGGTVGGVANAYMQHLAEVNTATGREAESYKNVLGDVQRSDPGGGTRAVNDPKILNREFVKRYIADRENAVKARVQQARAVGGEALAEKVLNQERTASVRTLSDLLTKYGYTAKAAQDTARDVYSSADALNKMSGAGDTATTALKNVNDVVASASLQIGDINTKLDAFSGKKIATLEVNGQQVVFASLQEALTYQRALMTGLDLKSAGQAVARDQEATRKGLYGHAADGGLIGGYSPHPKADNIPTMLTAKEYVQPVDAVKHYGVGFMEAVRTKKLPRMAAGGQVGSSVEPSTARWPFKVDVSKTKIPDPNAYVPTGAGGAASGDVNVARIAEATARTMGASDKQLISLMEAGLVESGLRNLNYGDRDSIGFLQQRPSQGWGSVAQIMNVAYATRKFIDAAMLKDRGVYTAGQLAQAVQRSAYPDRYDKRYGDAVAVLNLEAPTVGGAAVSAGPMFGPWPANAASVHGHDSGIWRKIIAMVPPSIPTQFSGAYNNRRTDNGGWSWHASGHAVDFGGYNQDALAQFFEARQGAVLELIHRTTKADYGIQRGHQHNMGHEYGLHRNHLHVAMNQGGLVQPRKYDTGGVLPPGFTLAYNGTGKNETVRTNQQEKRLDGPVRLHRADIQLLAATIATAANPAITMDGRAVAEVTNKYTYLPAGV